MRRSIRWNLFFCAFLLAWMPKSASAQALTGSLFGTVSDTSGARLPGVKVMATSPQLITGRQAVVSSEAGAYRLVDLPPGTYTLAFELAGFKTLERREIVLLAGQSLAVDAQLEVSTVHESVVVTGQAPLIDTRSAALAGTADNSTLKQVPLPRNPSDLLNLIPGVTDGAVVHGGTVRQNVYSLDGVNTDDPNTNAPVTDLPFDAFEEVQVTTAGIPAEFGNGSGGVFNYLTKSGGNRLHGSANFFFQTNALESSNVSSALRRQGLTLSGLGHQYDGSGTLGGPIRKDRAWFFTSFRHVDRADRRSDFSSDILTTDSQLFSKASLQVSKSNKAEVSFYYRNDNKFPFQPSFRNSADPRTWFGTPQEDYVTTVRWTSLLSSKTIFEARGNLLIDSVSRSTPNNVGAPIYIDQATNIVTGGDTQPNSYNQRNRHQFRADLSHFKDNLLGTHNFKLGVDWQAGPSFDRRFLIFARGPNELNNCSDRCLSATPDTVHELFNGKPFRVQLWNTPRFPRYETGSLAVYAQDQWVFRERYTLTLGLRLEHENGKLPQSSGGGGRWEPQIAVFPEQKLVDLYTLAPRLGFAWDLTGGHRTTIKASYGRFFYQITNFQISNASAAAQQGFQEFDWSDKNGDGIYEPGEEGILRNDTRPNLARLPTVDPNLKDQYNDVVTLGFERMFQSSWALALTAIAKREHNLLGTVNALVPFSAYDPLSVTNPLTGQPMTIYTLRTSFRGQQGQTVLTNPGREPGDLARLVRKYEGLEVVLRRRLQRGFQLEASYVWGRAIGNVGNAFSESNFFFYTNPNFLVNSYGDLELGPRHQFKTHGVYQLRHGLLFSAYFRALSGVSRTDASGPTTVKGAATARFFKTQYPQIQSETFIDAAVEPSGTRKFDPLVSLDLRAEKLFKVREGSLSVAVDIFNILNADTTILVQSLNLSNPNFGIPAQLQSPRNVRLALKWNF